MVDFGWKAIHAKFSQPSKEIIAIGASNTPSLLDIVHVQGSTIRRASSLVNFVPAVAYLNLPATFSQLRNCLIVEPCITLSLSQTIEISIYTSKYHVCQHDDNKADGIVCPSDMNRLQGGHVKVREFAVFIPFTLPRVGRTQYRNSPAFTPHF